MKTIYKLTRMKATYKRAQSSYTKHVIVRGAGVGEWEYRSVVVAQSERIA